MMKRVIALILFLTMVPFLPYAAAEDAEAPRFIEAREGQPAAMQIRSLDSGETVGILGVESEPRPCTWGEFSAALSRQLEGISFSPAYWSDGCWVHLLDSYDLVIRVRTTDQTDEGMVQSVLVNTPSDEGAGDVQAVASLAYYAAACPGTYGVYIVNIALSEDHSGDWFTDSPRQIWTENGYTLSFGRTDGLDLPCGEVHFSEEMTVSGGYRPLDQHYVYLPEGKSPASLIQALTAQAQSGPLASWITAPVLPETYETRDDGRVYLMDWDDCLLILYTDGTGENLRVVNLFSMSGDTGSMCLHLYPLYIAAAGGRTEDMMLISAFVGGNGTWDDMSLLEPYCVMNGVQLRCSLAEMGDGNALPMADICGAEEKEAADAPAGSAEEEMPEEAGPVPEENTAARFSYRGAVWGMTREEVRALENGEPYLEPAAADGCSALVYRVGAQDQFRMIQYNFLPSDALYNIEIMVPDASGSFYAEQKESLTAQYGEPLTEADADMEAEDAVAVMMASLIRTTGDTDFLGWQADDETVIILSREPANAVCYVEIRRYTDYFRFQ